MKWESFEDTKIRFADNKFLQFFHPHSSLHDFQNHVALKHTRQ